MTTIERETTTRPLEVTDQDLAWIVNFGAEYPREDDRTLVHQLNELVDLGSVRMNPQTDVELRSEVVSARESFMNIVGVKPGPISRFKKDRPTLLPLDTFINAQRAMFQLGLDAPRIIDDTPSSLNYTAESIHAKIDVLTQIGIDAASVINQHPASLGLSGETVRQKVALYETLGLDPVKIINKHAPALGFSVKSIRSKFDGLTDLGLDAKKVVSGYPAVLGLAPETVTGKMKNFTDLGLDGAKLVNAYPHAISFATESVAKKYQVITEIAQHLRWSGSSKELAEEFPRLFSFNIQKLFLLGAIGAKHIDASQRDVSVEDIRKALANPIENYLLATTQLKEPQEVATFGRFVTNTYRSLSPAERKKRALEASLSGQLGRLGAMYLRYANIAIS